MRLHEKIEKAIEWIDDILETAESVERLQRIDLKMFKSRVKLARELLERAKELLPATFSTFD